VSLVEHTSRKKTLFAGKRPELFFLLSLALLASVAMVRWTQQPASTTAPAVSINGLGGRVGGRDAQAAAAQLQAFLKDNPGSSGAYAQLGTVYLQLARESGDPSFYSKADEVFQQALKHDEQSVDAMVGLGTLALARHQFAQALEWGERAHTANPYLAQALGVKGDALIELGRYDEAVAVVQQMVDTRPDLASYSRVSYLRELHGDLPGAIDAMRRAVAAGGPATENTAWVAVQLGNLHFNSGDLAGAAQAYQQAMALLPNYAYGRAGLARIAAAEGRYDAAIAEYRAAIDVVPLPEFVIGLGEVYERAGQAQAASDQWALVGAMQQLNQASGVDVDLELALFEADRDQNLTEALTTLRAAYERRPGIHAADALAWALFKNGQLPEARRYSDEALRLGTRDALMHYHAGRIAEAQGEAARARQLYQQALTINPHFSLRYAPDAKERLQALQ
jgi:tetratricopeptide (TPR) repeat protein